MAQACAQLCHQHRHLLIDVRGNGESGENIFVVAVKRILLHVA